jgi:hypothetical protein
VNDGCRCEACRQANTEYHRIYRDRLANGYLQVLCWCESTPVVVPAEMVRAGQTASCGRPGCGQDDDAS